MTRDPDHVTRWKAEKTIRKGLSGRNGQVIIGCCITKLVCTKQQQELKKPKSET